MRLLALGNHVKETWDCESEWSDDIHNQKGA
jgi:hypothetical protein